MARASSGSSMTALSVISISSSGAGRPLSASALATTSGKSCLRSWRAGVARARNVPAYVVLHDATIDGIASEHPTTLDQLREIPGIGDKKLEHYGADILAIVNG